MLRQKPNNNGQGNQQQSKTDCGFQLAGELEANLETVETDLKHIRRQRLRDWHEVKRSQCSSHRVIWLSQARIQSGSRLETLTGVNFRRQLGRSRGWRTEDIA